MNAVELAGVGKRFYLQHDRSRSFQEVALSLFRRRSREEFWALRDVSFAVPAGQTFGIIGANGSGKSTLLKLLTGIMPPTTGQISRRGRIAPLLELGTGFHPDLTGRENVYLNAALLGFGRRDTDARFDRIVEFAGLTRFVDMPLKHYSSGMQVRLGFSIAIHSEPDLLVADEVLAVGDEAFQRACIDRILELGREGRTIILVSHSLDHVRNLCSRTAWLEQGRLRALGETIEITDDYLAEANRQLETGSALAIGAAPGDVPDGRRWGSGEVEVVGLELLNSAGAPARTIATDQPLTIRIRYRAQRPIERPTFGIAIHYGDHLLLAGPNSRDDRLTIDRIEGEGAVDYTIDALPFLPGIYQLSVAIYDEHGRHAYDHRDRAHLFQVQPGAVHQRYGLVHLPSRWTHQPSLAGRSVMTESVETL